MRKRLHYIFSRLLILVIAIRILDVSIDIDHLIIGSPVTQVAGYDDTDSFSELIIESVTGNKDLIAETKNEDNAPSQKQSHKFHSIVYVNQDRKAPALAVSFHELASNKQYFSHVNLQADDFSGIFCPPPELG